MMKSKTLPLLFTALSLMLLAVSTGITRGSFVDPETSSDNVLRTIVDWYDFGWHWRKPLTISNSGGTLSDYQVKVTINTQELISAGKMQSDGDDIRFTASDGITVIPYWIESGLNTSSTIIWVKVPSIPGGDSTIYIYYSNDSAGPASSVSGTFNNGSFQDLFADISNLDTDYSSGVTVNSGEAQLIVADTEVTDVNQSASTAAISVYGDQWCGQTFYANLTGFLSKVTIRTNKVGSPPNPLKVEIRNAVGNEPGSTIYATASRNDIGGSLADYNFNFNIPVAVTAGTQYAIVIKTPGGDASNNYNNRYNADVYLGGRALLSNTGGSSWTGYDAYDYYFKTYITVASELDQSQIAANNNWQVYSNHWGAQSFVAGESGNLTMVVINAYTTGSPPGDLTVEIQDAEEYFIENLDQSQTSYFGERPTYSNNWTAQTFRSGASGELGKITLRASKTGSPPNDLFVELRNVTTGSQQYEDQSQTSFSGDRQIYDDNWRAQIFQAGLSDDLTKITLRASKTGSPSGNLTVELRDVSGGSEENLDQSQTNYATGFGIYDNNWLGQTFQAGISGTLSKVTLGLARVENEDQSQTSFSGDRQVYDNNWRAQIFQAGASGNLSNITLRTSKTGSPPNDLFVELRNTTTGYQEAEDQSQTSFTGDRQVYDNNWIAQIFQAGASADLSKVTLRAARTGSPSGNLTVELRNTTSGYQDIEDQSQTSSDGDRQVYGNNWIAQIFQAGTSADLSKITLNASKTGSPPNDLTVELRNAIQDEILDQSQTSYGNSYNIYSNRWVGQTFQAGASGELTKVTLTLAKAGSPPDFVVEIRDCTVGDLPGTTVLASATRSDIDVIGQYDFTFGSPASITAGTKYAIVCHTTGGSSQNNYPFSYDNSDNYNNGRACLSNDSGSSWSGYSNRDTYFQTYVTINAYVPGSTVHASTSRGDITTAGEYDFTYSSPYTVTSGTKYAIVIYTSGGDASNYYGVSYDDSDVYANGRECSSASGGASWTGSSTDLFFRTYVSVPTGFLPGSTVYASVSRSDITSAGEYDFTYSSPYTVTSGTKYAIVIYTSGGDSSNYYGISYQDSNAYASGRECSSSSGGASWSGSDSTDLYFRTYLIVPTGDIPGSTVYATTSRSDITSAGEYDFTYSSPYAVTSGTKYAIVIYTSGGDASNYYGVGYQNSNAYANGRECSSTSSGASWTGGSTDLFFRTKMGNPLGTIDVQIRNCAVDDKPGTTVYASASKNPLDIGTTFATYDFTFGSPASVTAGVKYAIVIKTDGGDADNHYPVYYQTSNDYANGRANHSGDYGSLWTGYDAFDFLFQTYVTINAYTPGSTVYASTSRGDITTAGEYEFTYSSPYTITAGTKYAIVIYTSGGDASNHYGVSYQNSDAYTNGRECFSGNSGTDWTGSSSTDLFFRTYITVQVGDTPGSIVYASTSRNDITTSGDYDFVFGSPYNITAETNYAIVVYTSGGDASNYYGVGYQNSNAYGLGKECISINSGGSWIPNGSADLYFMTYITQATGKYQPAGTVYASASRSGIGSSAQDHVFFFSTPAAITSGTRYTIVVKTAGGDASNCYNVAYQNVDVYGNGDRSYSSNSGTDWTMTGHDLWFKTYVEFGKAVSASGTLRSTAIPVYTDTRFAAGIQLSWNDTEQASSDIKYQIEYYTGSAWSLIPDSDLDGNSAGFDTSPIDISSVLTDYDQIRLRASLSSTYSTYIPGIQDWTVTYYYREYNSPEPGIDNIGDEE